VRLRVDPEAMDDCFDEPTDGGRSHNNRLARATEGSIDLEVAGGFSNSTSMEASGNELDRKGRSGSCSESTSVANDMRVPYLDRAGGALRPFE
jgi:hypothetical protein